MKPRQQTSSPPPRSSAPSAVNYPKRLIEVDLPIRTISEHARKDQNIRKGHLHTIHVWWATRPLASCRAVLMATLLPDPADPHCPPAFVQEARRLMFHWATRHAARAGAAAFARLVRIQKNAAVLDDPVELRGALLDFIADFAAWDAGVDPHYLETARALVAAAHPDGPPLVLDPFAGAGSIPFEALRVGAQAFAGDLNPVAVLINKVALEYLPRYGKAEVRMQKAEGGTITFHGLAEAVEYWGKWVLEEARKRLAPYYPADSHGHIPLAYIWARTITCEGPGCGAEVPLLGMLWLSKKSKNPVALRYRGVKAEGGGDKAEGRRQKAEVIVELFQPRSAAEVQPPIVNRMTATCPCCGYTTPYKSVREQVRRKRGGTLDARLLAVITLDKNGGRHFRLPEEADLAAAARARRDLERIAAGEKPGLPWVPDEPFPAWYSGVFNPGLWGIGTWGGLFTPRQALALGTFCRLVGEAREQIAKGSHDTGFADAMATCIGLAVTNTAPLSSAVSWCDKNGMRTAFMGSGLPIKPDFAEANPLMPKLVGGVEYALGLVQSFSDREGAVLPNTGTAQRGSATEIPLPDDSAGYVVTDPPYYDAVPYSALSDFCYVWLKRSLTCVYPDLLQAGLTTHHDEIVVDRPHRDSNSIKDSEFYERRLTDAFSEARRVLSPAGVALVMFASKTTKAWEATLASLVNAGFIMTASWPVDTERQARMQAKGRAVLASTIHLVCRPREGVSPRRTQRGAEGNQNQEFPPRTSASSAVNSVGDWREVLAELPRRIHEWLPRLAEEGIVGADAIFACLGPALEVFSRYARVEKASGEQVSLREYLEQVWAAVSQEALRMVFEGADASGLEEDARLTAMWLWTLGTRKNLTAEDAEERRGGEDQSEDGVDEPDDQNSLRRSASSAVKSGFSLEYDAARKIAQGLGAHLEKLTGVVAVEGETARLLPVAERTRFLFGRDQAQAPTGRRKKKDPQMKLAFAQEVEQAEAEGGWGEKGAPRVGQTVLDRVHQSMILFAAGRSEALRRFLVEEGVGRDGRFWTLAQALSALYPSGSSEKRWVEGVLARKKGLGF